MQYLLRLTTLASALSLTLAFEHSASAGNAGLGSLVHLQPCPVALSRPGPERLQAPPFEFSLPGPEGTVGDTRSSGSVSAEADSYVLFGVLATNRPHRDRVRWDTDEYAWGRRGRRPVHVGVQHARARYGLDGWIATACMAVGALTIACGAASFPTLKLIFKPWRAGGVLGIQGRF